MPAPRDAATPPTTNIARSQPSMKAVAFFSAFLENSIIRTATMGIGLIAIAVAAGMRSAIKWVRFDMSGSLSVGCPWSISGLLNLNDEVDQAGAEGVSTEITKTQWLKPERRALTMTRRSP